MRFAVAAKYKKLCPDFGSCSEFAIMDVQDNKVITELYWTSPPHEPNRHSEWFYHEMKVNAVIAGKMDQQTRQSIVENGIHVVTGATAENPRSLVEAYLDGKLVSDYVI